MTPKTNEPIASRWASFPTTYRKEEFAMIATMLRNEQSGVIIGGSGSGKSNVGGMFTARPDITYKLLPDKEYLFCFVDINKFPSGDTVGFYRGMIHELYKAARRSKLPIADSLRKLEIETRAWDDSLSWVFAMEEAHNLIINDAGKRVVWLLDRFDKACPTLDVDVLDVLRSLRDGDSFYGKIFYLIFTRKPLQRLRDWTINSEFLELVENNSCFIGPMIERDACWNVQQIATRHKTTIPVHIEKIIVELAGGLPAFTKAVSEAWIKDELSLSMSMQDLAEHMIENEFVNRTCKEIFTDLEQIERDVLKYIASERLQIGLEQSTVTYLQNHGLIKLHEYLGELKQVEKKWAIFSPLFKAYVMGDIGNRIITVNIQRKKLLLDGLEMEIHLRPQVYNLAEYLVERPNEAITYEQFISHIWPNEQDYTSRIEGLHAANGELRRAFREFSRQNNITPGLDTKIINEGGCYIFEQKM